MHKAGKQSESFSHLNFTKRNMEEVKQGKKKKKQQKKRIREVQKTISMTQFNQPMEKNSGLHAIIILL